MFNFRTWAAYPSLHFEAVIFIFLAFTTGKSNTHTRAHAHITTLVVCRPKYVGSLHLEKETILKLLKIKIP